MEKGIRMHLHKPHATSQPLRLSHTHRLSTDSPHNSRSYCVLLLLLLRASLQARSFVPACTLTDPTLVNFTWLGGGGMAVAGCWLQHSGLTMAASPRALRAQ